MPLLERIGTEGLPKMNIVLRRKGNVLLRISSFSSFVSSSTSRCFFRTAAAAAVFSFGDNSHGALGLPAATPHAYEPTRIPGLPPDISTVAAGHYHSLALTYGGEVWAWGRDEEAQLGRRSPSPRFPSFYTARRPPSP